MQEGHGPDREEFRVIWGLGVFNSTLMNDAVYKFKRYEDSSLSYAGINKHEGGDIGLYDTVITRKDVQKVFEKVQASADSGTSQNGLEQEK